jgi:hypothetical protein
VAKATKGWHFRPDGITEGVIEFFTGTKGTDAMTARTEAVNKFKGGHEGRDYAQEKAKILAENEMQERFRPKTKFGYHLEPWEQRTAFIEKALRKGANTMEAGQMWASQARFIADPKSEGAKDFNTLLDEKVDVDSQGQEFPEAEVEEAAAEGADPAAAEEGPADAGPADPEPAEAGPVGPEDPAAPEPAPQLPGAEVGAMVQPEVQQSFRPMVQNEQQWMDLKNSFGGAGAGEPANQPKVGTVDFRNNQFDKGLEARSKKHREGISNRNKQWANIGA